MMDMPSYQSSGCVADSDGNPPTGTSSHSMRTTGSRRAPTASQPVMRIEEWPNSSSDNAAGPD